MSFFSKIEAHAFSRIQTPRAPPSGDHFIGPVWIRLKSRQMQFFWLPRVLYRREISDSLYN
jgi:hypothetical protein